MEEEEGILKQGANVALGALETVGKGVDYLNDQVTLGNLIESNPVTKTPFNIARQIQTKVGGEWVDKVYDYSYKDLRDDLSEGAGWATEKVTGSKTAGKVAEFGTQIALPDAVDVLFAGLPVGALGKVFTRGSKTANRVGDTTAIVSKVNPSKLNDLKAFSFATKVDNLTGGNVKSEVMQMLSKGGDNLDGIFTGRTNQLITDYKAKYPNREIYARTNIDEAVDIRKGLKAKGEKVPYFLDLTDNRLKYVVKKGTDYYGPGKHR